jgi:hypothetical protein
MVMPRSKLAVTEEEEKQPENVAARTLGYRAREDISNFWAKLARKFAMLAVEEVQALLPHIKTELIEDYGYQFHRTFGYHAQGRRVEDVMLAAIAHAYVKETADGINYRVEHKPPEPNVLYDDDGEIEEYLLRERVYALAQSVMDTEDDPGNDRYDHDEDD